MKALHVISSMGVTSGGPARSVLLTTQGLRSRGVDAGILCCDHGDELICTDEFVHVLPYAGNVFCYSPHYRGFMRDRRDYDLYHAHGVWLYPTLIAARLARRWNKPYIITPRGMLYPQDMVKSGLKKQLFLKLFLQRDLQHAACVHATCRQEMLYLRDLGVRSPIAVIPNPVDISGIEDPVPVNDVFRVGYLGRVSRRKRIERLLYAWAELGEKVRDCELVIIGGGDDNYMAFLVSEKERLALSNVTFAGFLKGERKRRAVDSLSVLAVPSDFENFGNVIPEALVRGVPVIATKGAPWEELPGWDCGWWVEGDVPSLTCAIGEAVALPPGRRAAMGRNGKKLVGSRYGVRSVSAQMAGLYEWILHGGTPPQTVFYE